MFVAETERSECFRYCTTITAYAFAENGLWLLLSMYPRATVANERLTDLILFTPTGA